jgi:hypothetical protein
MQLRKCLFYLWLLGLVVYVEAIILKYVIIGHPHLGAW